MHHVAWGIVCVLLVSVVFGLWTRVQTLDTLNTQLQTKLAAAQVIRTVSTDCRADIKWTSNSTTELSIATPAGSRDFYIHLPNGFTNNTVYPLVVFYPGKGASAEAAKSAYGLDKLPSIVAYPFPTHGKDGFLSWQGAPYSSGSNDVGFTSAILDKLQSELCIDKSRIYAVGMSNGGGFVSLLSCTLSDRFAAVAIMSGAFYQPDGSCQPSRAIPLLNIHGDSDPVVPYAGSTVRQLPPIDDWVSMRARMDGCGSSATTYPNVSTTVTTWNNCASGSVVQNIRVNGGGHDWGQIPNGTLWAFLSQFSR